MQTPSERTSLWLLGSKPLSESANFFLEAFVHQRESAQQASPTHQLWGIPADNYYNPFGVEVPTVARRFIEAGNRVVSEDVDLWRALIGLEGAVARWQWELAVGNARSEGDEY